MESTFGKTLIQTHMPGTRFSTICSVRQHKNQDLKQYLKQHSKIICPLLPSTRWRPTPAINKNCTYPGRPYRLALVPEGGSRPPTPHLCFHLRRYKRLQQDPFRIQGSFRIQYPLVNKTPLLAKTLVLTKAPLLTKTPLLAKTTLLAKTPLLTKTAFNKSFCSTEPSQ